MDHPDFQVVLPQLQSKGPTGSILVAFTIADAAEVSLVVLFACCGGDSVLSPTVGRGIGDSGSTISDTLSATPSSGALGGKTFSGDRSCDSPCASEGNGFVDDGANGRGLCC